jgi:hypothetical protein
MTDARHLAEQAIRQLAGDIAMALGFKQDEWGPAAMLVEAHLKSALAAAGDREARLREAAQYIHDKFAADEAAGYRSRDRQFAIEILAAALAEPRP